jgi:hypothetical protein
MLGLLVLPVAGQTETMPHVGVFVRNLSIATPEAVEDAEAIGHGVFRSAGIKISWINNVDNIVWREPDLILRAVILPEAPPSRAATAFGTALRARRELLLYYDRIQLGSTAANIPVHVMMSLALVHEVGHLLLDSDEHAASGVMRAEWGQAELAAVQRGQMRFTADQCRRMKANLAKLASAKPK